MTSLRKRLDNVISCMHTSNVISELGIIIDLLSMSDGHPPCCLTFQKNGETSCEVIGPLPKKEFLRECRKCKEDIRNFLERVRIEDR